ncbi:erythromycin esterase family protein [Flammeovirga kamogawensis]|uniref:Erythromycin esterase family protein n=1 Tax=Flammeovirga kamogawensis TaxID=373891 RepID=A0ABX8GTN1_9BACT|nr:erythromycin esterase family protein [Flammeovirga kamogawensis]MBB6460036.1 erythromycin esterase [Flammeovirga kamogawensis]QWG06916.1 erythromycin esterase family protein [Flammeovirga kamogawensis]TRX68738.1 erythromycin esterase family protein [Flammeovirga kamogawensis]
MNYIITSLILLLPIHIFAQKDFDAYVIANTSEIKSLDINYENDNDLTAIKTAIGDARVVMLGEQDHGTGTAFIMKARLIKYLHEQMGFDVIAYESNFYEMQGAYEHDSLNFEDAYEEIFPIWTKCGECKPSFSYIKNTLATDRPLYTTGFDMQFYFKKNFYDDFLKFYEDNHLIVNDEKRFFHIFKTLLKNNQSFELENREEDLTYYFKELNVLYNSYDKDDFWKQVLHSLIGYSEMRTASSLQESLNIRDNYMADNLLWLTQKRFPNKKIIVWAHNYHISRVLHKNFKAITMTDKVYEVLGDQMYSLGFISSEGTTGWANRDNTSSLRKVKNKKFLENKIAGMNFQQAFLDFKSYSGDPVQFLMRYHWGKAYKLYWLDTFDGVIYIDKIYPCTKKEEQMIIQ